MGGATLAVILSGGQYPWYPQGIPLRSSPMYRGADTSESYIHHKRAISWKIARRGQHRYSSSWCSCRWWRLLRQHLLQADLAATDRAELHSRVVGLQRMLQAAASAPGASDYPGDASITHHLGEPCASSTAMPREASREIISHAQVVTSVLIAG